MRKIEIDDEVFAVLQLHARPLEDAANDVLRRLLLCQGNGEATRPSGETRPSRPRKGTGDLMPFLEAGLLQPGDQLTHSQPRKGLVHQAVVAADGWLEVAGRPFPKVSPALKACVGHEINGWGQWTHKRTGRRLQSLREELARRQNGV